MQGKALCLVSTPATIDLFAPSLVRLTRSTATTRRSVRLEPAIRYVLLILLQNSSGRFGIHQQLIILFVAFCNGHIAGQAQFAPPTLMVCTWKRDINEWEKEGQEQIQISHLPVNKPQRALNNVTLLWWSSSHFFFPSYKEEGMTLWGPEGRIRDKKDKSEGEPFSFFNYPLAHACYKVFKEDRTLGYTYRTEACFLS